MSKRFDRRQLESPETEHGRPVAAMLVGRGLTPQVVTNMMLDAVEMQRHCQALDVAPESVEWLAARWPISVCRWQRTD